MPKEQVKAYYAKKNKSNNVPRKYKNPGTLTQKVGVIDTSKLRKGICKRSISYALKLRKSVGCR